MGGGLRRFMLVRLCLVLAALGALGALPPAAHAARPFSASSVWNTPISPGAEVDPLSALRVSDLRTLMTKSTTVDKKPPALNYKSWSTTVYFVSSSTPKQPIVITGDGPKNLLLQQKIDAHGGVPFPPGAEPSDENDAHITVVNADTGTLYEFFETSTPAQNADGRWHAGTGGIISDHRLDPGYFSPNSWPGLGPNDGWNWGGTATSLPILGGLITLEDLDSGVIDHALQGLTPQTCKKEVWFPAQRNDRHASQTHAYCMPEGARLQLDPAVNVESDPAFQNNPLLKMIGHAAQDYGIIINDTTGANFAFRAQDPGNGTPDPYETGPGVGGVGNEGYLAGKEYYSVLDSFPWGKLRVLKAPRSCPADPEVGPCPPP